MSLSNHLYRSKAKVKPVSLDEREKMQGGVVMPRAAPRNDEKQAQINRFTDWRNGLNLLIS
jgi:hypothetical protein